MAFSSERRCVPLTARSNLRPLAAVVAAAFATSACTLLPPSLRAPEEPVAMAAPVVERRSAETAKPADAATPPTPKVYPGTGQFLQTQPPRIAPPGPEEASLNFEALDVREVAKVILGDYLKQTYTVHPAVTGTVTFRTVRPIPTAALLPTLEMLLRQNNAAVVVEEGVYKILPIAAVRGSVSPQLGGTARAIPHGFNVLVVPLRFVGAREMQRLLEPFASDNTIRIDEVRNLVIMAGSQRELRHLVDTIDLFDVDWLAGYSVGLFPLRGADVKSIVQDLDRVFGPAAQGPLAGIVRVVPIERLNSLLIITTQPKYLEMARTWIERIDQAGGATGGGTRFFVYQVRNGKAENLASLISELFASRRTTTSAPTLAPGARPTELRSTPFGQPQPSPQTTTTSVTPPAGATTFTLPGAAGATSSDVRVIADKDTNSLLILATPADYEVIESAVRRLDVIPRQVMVEVMLAEVTLDDQFQAGIDWFITGPRGTSGTLSTNGLLPITSAASGGTSIIDRATRAIGSVPFADGLQLINLSGERVRAVLRLMETDQRVKVLAAPNIMVLDNQKAQIKVGDRISVQTQSQTGVNTGAGVLNSFQYLETGVLLAVTPRINSGGLVTLEVNQEVSQPSGVGTDANPNPNVNSRSAQTTVVVASGESIALAGMINETNSRDNVGIPLLSKIPVIGAVFGSQTLRKRRTELVLVITPRIVSDTNQAREVTEELRQRLPALQEMMPKPKSAPPPAPALPTPPPPPQGASK